MPRRGASASKASPDCRPGAPRPGAVAGAVAPRPPASPHSAALLVERPPPALHFRSLVRYVAPDAYDRIWRARYPDCGREAARVAAFLDLLRADWFAVVERDHPAYHAYTDVTAGIPLARYGWDDDDLYGVHDFRPGYLALYTLAEAVYQDYDYRIGLLGELESLVPGVAIDRVPIHGVPRDRLRAAVEGGPFTGLADFADWIARETGFEYLDTCYEEGTATAWTRQNLARLREEWPHARALLDRVDALVKWLEADEANARHRFDSLLVAALGGIPTIVPDSIPAVAPPDMPGAAEDAADRAQARAA